MNFLIITHSCKDDYKIIDYHDTLYVFSVLPSKVKTIKYVDSSLDIEEYIFKAIKKYKNHYEYIVSIHNDFFVDIDNLFKFKKEQENWILSGKKIQSFYNDKLYFEKFDINELFVACKNLDDSLVSLLQRQQVNDVQFGYFSRIICHHNSRCIENKSLGIYKKRSFI